MEVSQKTTDALLNAGWFPNRKLDTTEIEELIESRGFKVYEPVKKFLEEFADLKIMVNSDNMIGTTEVHKTTIKELYYPEFMRSGKSEAERNANEMLVPVGSICDGTFLLYISETGKMYCSIGKLGDTAWEGWERLISEERFMLWGSY